jgi:hypothetical protein
MISHSSYPQTNRDSACIHLHKVAPALLRAELWPAPLRSPSPSAERLHLGRLRRERGLWDLLPFVSILILVASRPFLARVAIGRLPRGWLSRSRWLRLTARTLTLSAHEGLLDVLRIERLASCPGCTSSILLASDDVGTAEAAPVRTATGQAS